MSHTNTNPSNHGTIRRLNLSFVLAGLTWFAIIASGTVEAVYVDPNTCGGDQQPACHLSEAKFLGKVHVPNPGGGAFWDPRSGGEWWSCDGWRRTIFAVTASNACETGSWPLSLKHKSARFISKATNPKPSGAFVDPRLDNLSKGAEYWRCPSGFTRNANHIEHSAACSATIGMACDSGNIDVASPYVGQGYTCYKKGECGAKGQRPCLLVERIPSCDSGLAEDFVDGRCVDKKLAECLTVTRALNFAKKGGDWVNKIAKHGNNPLSVTGTLGVILDIVPEDSPIKNAKKFVDNKMKQLGDKVKKESDKLLLKMDASGNLLKVSNLAKTAKTKSSQLMDILADPQICTQPSSTLYTRLDTVLNLSSVQLAPPTAELFRSQYASQSPWLDYLFPPAFAGVTDLNIYFVLGGSLEVVIPVKKGLGGGGAFDVQLVVDTQNGDVGIVMGVAGLGAFNASAVNVSSYLGIRWGKSLDDLGGHNMEIGVGADAPAKIGKSSVELGMTFLIDEFDKDFGQENFLTGVMFQVVGVGSKRPVKGLPLDVSVSYGYEWCVTTNCTTTTSTPTTAVPDLLAGSEPGFDRMGSDYKTFIPSPAHPALCQSACANEAQCQAWTYQKAEEGGPKCYLKNSAGTSTASTCCISGLKTPMEDGFDRQGNDYKNFIPSPADPAMCQSACSNEAQCEAWTYQKSEHGGPKCYLKNSAGTSTVNDCCTSGLKIGTL